SRNFLAQRFVNLSDREKLLPHPQDTIELGLDVVRLLQESLADVADRRELLVAALAQRRHFGPIDQELSLAERFEMIGGRSNREEQVAVADAQADRQRHRPDLLDHLVE